MARLFVSFASPDLLVALEVVEWLRADGHDPFLDRDLTNGIRTGEDWRERLYRELRQADAVVSIVTTASVASSWCSAELGIADAFGCRLMPVRAEADVVHPLMKRQQYTDYHDDPREARARLIQALHDLDAAGAGDGWRDGDNPFPGLESFTAAFSTMFFGRSAEVREIANRLRAPTGSGDGVLAIIGPSGCGKSSLLNAGLLPLLDSDPAWLVLSPWVSGSDPLSGLARALTDTARRWELGWSVGDVRRTLDADADGLRQVADDLLAAGLGAPTRRLLIPIDQGEELFTRTSPAIREQLAALLCRAVAGPVQVVVTLRSEFLDDLRGLPGLAGVPVDAYVLAPLGREMLRAVVEGPAQIAGLRLDRELVPQLIDDTGSGEALPLLAFTLQQLADGVARGGTLTVPRYQVLGGVRGALTRHADAALTTAVATSGLSEQEVLAGLVRLVTIDDVGRRTRRRVSKDNLPGPLAAAMQVFIDRRLLVVDSDEDGARVSVAHEALLTAWRPLDVAIADMTTALRAARAVEQAAADWCRDGKPEHYLWDEKRLTTTLTNLGLPTDEAATAPAAGLAVDLDGDAHAFLDATRHRVQAVQRRERRRRSRTVAALSVLLVLALTAAGLAIWQQQVARDGQRSATVRNMIAQAEAARARDPRTALRLGAAAYQLDHSRQAEASLLETLTSTPFTGRLDANAGALTGAAFAADGRTLATADGDGSVILWDLAPLNNLRRNVVQQACIRAGGSLVEELWAVYAPGFDYMDACAA